MSKKTKKQKHVAKVATKSKKIVCTMTPDEYSHGLYAAAYLMTWAGEQFGGGTEGAKLAAAVAQMRADELEAVLPVAKRLHANMQPIDTE